MERRYLLLLAVLSLTSVASQLSSNDFLNIDCGKAEDYSYTDSYTHLKYNSDHQYISTGETHKVSTDLESASSEQTRDLRSFPNGKRNCYNLPTKSDTKYLLRARFMYGNYDNSNERPRFALHAGVNHWYSVNIKNASTNLFVDLIFVSGARGSLDLCLVNTGNGTPFISALELRPLPFEAYPQADLFQALTLSTRYTFGTTTSVRYPKDTYDRIWPGYTTPVWTALENSLPVKTMSTYMTPPDVLMTAVYPTSGSTLNISHPMLIDTAMAEQSAFVFFHFAELQQLKANESRVFNIILNKKMWSDLVVPTYLNGTVITSTNPEKAGSLEFVLVQTSDSFLPPIMNAMEIYMVREMIGVETAQEDVEAMVAIKAAYKVQKNWEGDPCSPTNFKWEGLNCSTEGSKNLRITSLNLTSSGLTGQISDAIGKLTQLQSLDLSLNSLTGAIQNTLANLTELTFLDLTGNNLDGTVPQALLDRSAAGVLTLKVGRNSDSCNNSATCANKNRNTTKVVAAVAASFVSVLVLALAIVVAMKWRKNKQQEIQRNVDGGQNSGAQNRQENSSFRLASLNMESKQFTYANLERITDRFQKEIGRGGFGPVFYGVLDNNVEVAVKLLSKSSSQGPREFKNEAILLTRIHHKNLVSFIGYCNDNINSLALVYEYMPEGSLHDHLRGRSIKFNTQLYWTTRLRISIEAAQGLEYLHHGCKPAIVHRDVKTNNILLNKNLEAKIADFGLSKNFDKEDYTHVSTKVMGTPGYLDPEYYTTNKLTEKSDVYSFGIVLLELITGLPAIITSKDNINIVHWVQENLAQGDIAKIVDERLQGEYDMNSVWKAIEIALACTQMTSTQRPNMSEVLSLLKDCIQLETGSVDVRTASQFSINDLNSNTSIHLLGIDMTVISNPPAR